MRDKIETLRFFDNENYLQEVVLLLLEIDNYFRISEYFSYFLTVKDFLSKVIK